VFGNPVRDSPETQGTGLCTASKISNNSSQDFAQDPLFFSDKFNAFMESSVGTRVESVLRTPFDLSNNNTEVVGTKHSYGDFEDAVPGCRTGGCDFSPSILNEDNKDSIKFGVRFRGYLNVTPAITESPQHFGFFTDDAVSFVLFDKEGRRYDVINRSIDVGFPTWRTTNSVTFDHPGLYPVEILYAALGGDSAVELSILAGAYVDFEREASKTPAANLRDDGFTLVAPTSFYQTESGRTSFPDAFKCEQCNRRNAGDFTNSGCDESYYCNLAAVCAPCDTSEFCGPSCTTCGANEECINREGTFTCGCSKDSQCPNGRCDLETNVCTGCNDDGDCKSQGKVCDVPSNTCVECNADKDCSGGKYCDGTQHVCRECTSDAHCPRGESCVANACQTCSSTDSCAGNSCNCCPGGLQCASLTQGGTPTCVECTRDTDCAEGLRCDSANGRCVEELSECNTSDRCGPQCSRCPEERPLCLDGQVCVQCRADTECGDGRFCLSGECTLCTTDNRCGSRCESCADDTPFCKTDGTVKGSACVGCRENADCGPGGTCDLDTNTCGDTGCSVTCDEGTVCAGAECVECFADAHCPCGGTCDTVTNTCTTLCNDSSDCMGVEFCSPATQQCERGRRMANSAPGGGAFCCGAAPEDTRTHKAPAALALLGLAALFLFRLRRAR
jgi:outer membrane exchange protein TraA